MGGCALFNDIHQSATLIGTRCLNTLCTWNMQQLLIPTHGILNEIWGPTGQEDLA